MSLLQLPAFFCLVALTVGTNLEPCCESLKCEYDSEGIDRVFDTLMTDLAVPQMRYAHARLTELSHNNLAYAAEADETMFMAVFTPTGWDYFMDPDNCTWDQENLAFDDECKNHMIFMPPPNSVLLYTCPDCKYDVLHIVTFNGAQAVDETFLYTLHYHTTIADISYSPGGELVWISEFILTTVVFIGAPVFVLFWRAKVMDKSLDPWDMMPGIMQRGFSAGTYTGWIHLALFIICTIAVLADAYYLTGQNLYSFLSAFIASLFLFLTHVMDPSFIIVAYGVSSQVLPIYCFENIRSQAYWYLLGCLALQWLLNIKPVFIGLLGKSTSVKSNVIAFVLAGVVLVGSIIVSMGSDKTASVYGGQMLAGALLFLTAFALENETAYWISLFHSAYLLRTCVQPAIYHQNPTWSFLCLAGFFFVVVFILSLKGIPSLAALLNSSNIKAHGIRFGIQVLMIPVCLLCGIVCDTNLGLCALGALSVVLSMLANLDFSESRVTIVCTSMAIILSVTPTLFKDWASSADTTACRAASAFVVFAIYTALALSFEPRSFISGVASVCRDLQSARTRFGLVCFSLNILACLVWTFGLVAKRCPVTMDVATMGFASGGIVYFLFCTSDEQLAYIGLFVASMVQFYLGEEVVKVHDSTATYLGGYLALVAHIGFVIVLFRPSSAFAPIGSRDVEGPESTEMDVSSSFHDQPPKKYEPSTSLLKDDTVTYYDA